MRGDFRFERRTTRVALAMGVMGLACFATSFMLSERYFALSMAAIFIGLLLHVGGVVVVGLRTGRTAADAHDHRYIICPSCRYDLRGLTESGECPECGRLYTHDELAQAWKHEMGMPHLDDDEELRLFLRSIERDPPA